MLEQKEALLLSVKVRKRVVIVSTDLAVDLGLSQPSFIAQIKKRLDKIINCNMM